MSSTSPFPLLLGTYLPLVSSTLPSPSNQSGIDSPLERIPGLPVLFPARVYLQT
jgi:hypothetical protein